LKDYRLILDVQGTVPLPGLQVTVCWLNDLCRRRLASIAAAWKGHKKVVGLLLRKGANVDKATGEVAALMRAAWEGRDKVVRLLLNEDANTYKVAADGDTALQGATRRGHNEVVKLSLGKGASTEQPNTGAALFVAAGIWHTDAVRLPLDHRTDANRSFDGQSAITVAAGHGHELAVQLSFSHCSGNFRMEALRAAARQEHRSIVQALLDS
jgi:ankyrin repeat protein